MLEIIKNPLKVENNQTKQSILQLQLDGLKEGWLIYVKTLNPLTLTIRKKETAEEARARNAKSMTVLHE